MNKSFYVGQPNKTTTRKVRSESSLNELFEDILGNVFPIGKKEKKEKALRSKRVGSFAFVVDDFEALTAVLEFGLNKGLTVAGDLTCRTGRTRGSITNLTLGDIVTVGVSDRFDIDWVRGGKGISDDIPLYVLTEDLREVSVALSCLILEKRDLENEERPDNRTFREMKLAKVNSYPGAAKVSAPKFTCGCAAVSMADIITVTDQYIKIGYEFIPYNPNTDSVNELIAEYVVTGRI